MRWGFSRDRSGGSGEPDITVRGVLYKIMGNLNKDDARKLIPLGHGDPSQFSSFRTTPVAQAAVDNAIKLRGIQFLCSSFA
uniref:Uncharacterized protein n=1 Tax=Kalanchoe fedtschenkoi TaxID=63787 RepID=A0A7N0RF43_KALFE